MIVSVLLLAVGYKLHLGWWFYALVAVHIVTLVKDFAERVV